MRLGFAVKVLGGGGLPSHDTRRWQSDPHLRVSLERLREVFDYLDSAGIDMYRMTASLAPYATHPDMPQFRGQVDECRDELAALGARGLRLSTHPGQYVVLNSEDERVRSIAVEELDLQAEVLDAMGLGPEAVVVLHVGGAAGGCDAGMDRFMEGFERLPERARRRLVIENDDRTYSLSNALAVSARTGLRVVWDILHHRCHDPDGIPDDEALDLSGRTWQGRGTQKIHYSSPRLDVGERKLRRGRRVERQVVLPPMRAHADLIDPIGFDLFIRTSGYADFDIMLEAKAKDLALIRLREQLVDRGYAVAGSVLVGPAAGGG